jgi:hypothetical protein
VIVVDKLLARGIGWVLRRVTDAVNHELVDESSLREELLAAEMRLELGEIDEDEFRRTEEAILARMREARGHRGTAGVPRSGMRYAVESIEADAGDEPARGASRGPRAHGVPSRGARKRTGRRSR